jgi:hypothetical protein
MRTVHHYIITIPFSKFWSNISKTWLKVLQCTIQQMAWLTSQRCTHTAHRYTPSLWQNTQFCSGVRSIVNLSISKVGGRDGDEPGECFIPSSAPTPIKESRAFKVCHISMWGQGHYLMKNSLWTGNGRVVLLDWSTHRIIMPLPLLVSNVTVFNSPMEQ